MAGPGELPKLDVAGSALLLRFAAHFSVNTTILGLSKRHSTVDVYGREMPFRAAVEVGENKEGFDDGAASSKQWRQPIQYVNVPTR